MTGVYSTDEPKYAYGGGNEGAMGDVMRNAVTIDLAHVADLVEEAYGGMASAEDNTGAVDHNTANIKNGTTRLLYGSYTFGKGRSRTTRCISKAAHRRSMSWAAILIIRPARRR